MNTSAGYYSPTARWINFGYFMNNGFYYTDEYTGDTIDVGKFMSVVAGPDIIFNQREINYYLENGAAAYAGLITNLPSQSATTNKSLGSVKALQGAYSKNLHELLNQGLNRDVTKNQFGSSAYVTFRTNNVVNQPVVVSDNTAAQRKSDYRTLQVLRIVNLASRLTKAVMYPFIGEPNNVEARTAMKTQLNTALNTMVEAGALIGGDGNGYQFTITSDPVETLLGQITVTLFLRPALEIKFVSVVVSVSS